MAGLVIRRFDVCEPPSRGRLRPPLIVVLSSAHLLDIDVVIAAPLVWPGQAEPDPYLNPLINFDHRSLTLIVSLLASVPHRQVGKVRGALIDQSDVIERALYRLFNGF